MYLVLQRAIQAHSGEKGKAMKVYIMEEEVFERIKEIAAALHGGSDAMRDMGHKLWLLESCIFGPMDIKELRPAEEEKK